MTRQRWYPSAAVGYNPSPMSSPIDAPSAPELRPPAAASPLTALLEASLRLLLLAGLLVSVVLPLQGHPPAQLVPALMIFGVLGAGYLLLSTDGVARGVRAAGQRHPLLMALPPLLLLLPVLAVNRAANTPADLTSALSALIFAFLPPALALINTPRLRLSDVGIGLVAVAAPLTLSVAKGQVLGGTEIALRLGAFALPVLLLIFTTREQKARLNFLLLCAALMLWYGVEFGALPDVVLPPMGDADGGQYFRLAVLPLFLYTLALGGKFEGLGLRFAPAARDVAPVLGYTAAALVLLLPAALLTGFVTFRWTAPAPVTAALELVGIYLTIALPEEILFRGFLLRYFNHSLAWSPAAIVALSALVFGAAHLNNPPQVGLYFVLATIAGVIYARVFLATRSVTASATVHALVDWIWTLAFPR